MRNLRNIRFGAWQDHNGLVTSTCWDPAKDELLCTLGPTELSSNVELIRISDKQSQLTHYPVATWESPSPSPDVASDTILSIHHFSDTSTTCIIFAGGDIVTVQEPHVLHEGGDTHVEIVGSIDAGITAARWSPDDELLALTTKEGNSVFMGRSFDPIADVSMTAEDLKLSKHVSVGWGKKETQFEGRGAKALRDPTIPEKVDEGIASSQEDGSASISWREDGAYVSVNSVQAGTRRVIRVYSREGVLDSVSEPVDGLEGSLSWRPSGNLIAGIQRSQDKVDVVFFERNGLRHGEFTLRSAGRPVTAHEKILLEWNSDSTVLAVILSDTIQLWTMGNYHWYLKQEIPFAPGISSLAWHPEKSLRFAAVTSSGVVSAEYIFTVARGSLRPPNDHGAVAVIDGQTVKATPFRTANVPPPMSMFDLDVSSSVVEVTFNWDNTLMAVLHHLGVDVYQWQTRDERSIIPKLLSRVTFESPLRGGSKRAPLQVCFSTSEELYVLVYETELKIETYSFGQSASPGLPVPVEMPDSSPISSISSSCGLEDGSAFAQDRSGKLFSLSTNAGLEPFGPRLSASLPWHQLVNIEGRTVALGMTRNGHLHADSRLLAKNCTSFVVTPDHLVFTTNNHFVKFVHLANPEKMEVPGDDPEIDERCRIIERGARLVTAVPTTMSLILQMPRGNLETIYPRAMVVAGIRKLIDAKDYGRAFSFCRTQRVDMNILYDHRPNQFLSNVGLFLDQLRDVSYIDLFLSALSEDDVTKSTYQDTKKTASQPQVVEQDASVTPSTDQPTKSKVNIVCDAVLKSLQNKSDSSVQNIITAHVCKVPAALDDGLALVAELMQEDEKVVERAVEHICFLVDVNRVYDNALGLYNLDLALLVAQRSQRDPREYLPFIQNLHQLPDLRRRFEIDDHLGRRAKALAHLKELEAFDELQAYTTKHSLYQEALGLYRYDKPRHRTLTRLYADHLETCSKFRDAGLAFEVLQDFPRATACYRAAGASSWRECLFAAQQQQNPPLFAEALSDLASVLADALTEAKDHTAAATIHLEYLSSPENAIRSLCKGCHFAEALRLVSKQQQQQQKTSVLNPDQDPDHLLTSVFDPSLVDALSSTTEFLADCKAQIKAQVPRILELRRRAAEDPLAFYEGERPGMAGDIPDDVSVAASSRMSTSASLFTRYTGKAGSVGTLGTGVSRATSRNRRREEKKRARGRKGTVYEEEYLVNSVRRLVERVEGTKGEVAALVFALVRRDMGERARAVEALMGEVMEGCKTAVGEVFVVPGDELRQGPQQLQQPVGGGSSAAAAEGFMSGSLGGGDAVLNDHLEARGRAQEPPVVTAFQKLTLLG